MVGEGCTRWPKWSFPTPTCTKFDALGVRECLPEACQALGFVLLTAQLHVQPQSLSLILSTNCKASSEPGVMRDVLRDSWVMVLCRSEVEKCEIALLKCKPVTGTQSASAHASEIAVAVKTLRRGTWCICCRGAVSSIATASDHLQDHATPAATPSYLHPCCCHIIEATSSLSMAGLHHSGWVPAGRTKAEPRSRKHQHIRALPLSMATSVKDRHYLCPSSQSHSLGSTARCNLLKGFSFLESVCEWSTRNCSVRSEKTGRSLCAHEF